MYKNQEGYRDPTAGKAIQDASRIPHHVKEAHKALKDIASLLGFEVLVLRDTDSLPKISFAIKMPYQLAV